MREGVEVSGNWLVFRRRFGPGGALIKSGIVYMYFRIFTYSSKILITNFDPMDSMVASGTWKNLRFFLRSCSLRDRDPGIKLNCSTCHPWCCNVAPSVHRRDSYWFSVRDRVRMRYWSVTSLIHLNSRMQKMTVFVLVGSRNTKPSRLSQPTEPYLHYGSSLVWVFFINFRSVRVRGRSSILTLLFLDVALLFLYF